MVAWPSPQEPVPAWNQGLGLVSALDLSVSWGRNPTGRTPTREPVATCAETWRPGSQTAISSASASAPGALGRIPLGPMSPISNSASSFPTRCAARVSSPVSVRRPCGAFAGAEGLHSAPEFIRRVRDSATCTTHPYSWLTQPRERRPTIMKVKDLHTSDVRACGPDTNLAAAAQIMWDCDCGIVPVVEDQKVVGEIGRAHV